MTSTLGHRLALVGTGHCLPTRLHNIRRARTQRIREPYHYDVPHPKDWWWWLPAASHPVGLDVRPYLVPSPARPGPVLRLHELLQQLGRPAAALVRVTRSKATDVVPLPAGVRGTWESWRVQMWAGAAPPDLSAWGHEKMQRGMWQRFPTQPRKDRRPPLAREIVAELGLTLQAGSPPTPPKPRRVCVCGCGRTIPATARANKRTFNQVCRNRLARQRQAA